MSDLTTVDEEAVGASDPRWAQAGLDYQRLHYWTTLGYLRTVDDDPTPGTGYARRWPVTEIAVAARMARLRQTGLWVREAEHVARASGPVEIGPGVWVGLADLEEATR